MRFRPLQDKTLVLHAGALSGGEGAGRLFGQSHAPAFQASPAPVHPGLRMQAPQSSLRVRP